MERNEESMRLEGGKWQHKRQWDSIQWNSTRHNSDTFINVSVVSSRRLTQRRHTIFVLFDGGVLNEQRMHAY